MNDQKLKVLWARHSISDTSCLVERLQKWSCEYCFAISYREALALLNQKQFELVLSELNLPDGSASRLIPWLVGSGSSLFFSFPVEDDCWWLPGIVYGHRCWGAPALRGSEFIGLLNELLQEMRSVSPRISAHGSAVLAKLCCAGCAVGNASREVPAEGCTATLVGAHHGQG